MATRPISHPRSIMALTALALLSERPLHPYEMQRLLHERHKFWAAGKTRELYRAIEELVAEGLVEAVETTREGRRPERTVYRVTAEGRETLEDRLSRLIERRVEEQPAFSIAVDLITALPQERAENALAARTVQLRAEMAGLDEARRALLEMHLPRAVLLEVELRQALGAAELRWVSATLDEMRTGKLGWSRELFARWADGEGASAAPQGGPSNALGRGPEHPAPPRRPGSSRRTSEGDSR
jgi:DNA-binding PadR family transcriptional regulator